MTMPSDPIAEVQALVGCLRHQWIDVPVPNAGDFGNLEIRCQRCNVRRTSESRPEPAPDCSTAKGAGLAARKLNAFEPKESAEFQEIALQYIYGELSQSGAGRAICELILQALEEK